MLIRTKLIFLLAIVSSCGILGIRHKKVITEFPSKPIEEINKSQLAKEMDSLINAIDSAPTIIPADLAQTTLVIETYQYEDFLKTNENKFYTPVDTKANRRDFKRYNRRKTSFLKNPIYNIIFVDQRKWDTLDVNLYRYVLKTTNRINYTVSDDGIAHPYSRIVLSYIYDRKTGKVFNEINDRLLLDKK